MKNNATKPVRVAALFLCTALLFVSAVFAQNSIRLDVDATRAAINIIHVKETFAAKTGDFDLYYPKWIPGEHSPTGTINDMVNLYITADGKPLKWQRDPVDIFAFHVTNTQPAKQIEVEFDDVSQPGTVATANLARIKWNRLLMYPRGVKSDDIKVTASMRVPAGWQYATALPVTGESGGAVKFGEVDLTAFIDSPAI